MLKIIRLAKAKSGKAIEYWFTNVSKRIPPTSKAIPIIIKTIEPIKATLFLLIFFSKAKSTSIQVFLFKFLTLITSKSKDTRISKAQPIGAK